MSKILQGKIYRYKIKTIFLTTLLILVFTLFLLIFFRQIIFTFTSLKTIQSFAKNLINQNHESINFQSSDSKFTIQNKINIINITSKSQNNITSQIFPTQKDPFLINNFTIKAEILDAKTFQKKEEINFTSKKAGITNISLSLIEDVKGTYLLGLNEIPQKILIFADKITFFENKEVYGNELFAIKESSTLKAKNFEIYYDNKFAKFYNKVFVENPEYKISSNNLNLYFQNNKISTAFFQDRVVFNQKNSHNIVIYGDNAIYKEQTGMIEIYGNVKSISKQNNTTIKGDKFYYNIFTKKGKLIGNKKANKLIELELEI